MGLGIDTSASAGGLGGAREALGGSLPSGVAYQEPRSAAAPKVVAPAPPAPSGGTVSLELRALRFTLEKMSGPTAPLDANVKPQARGEGELQAAASSPEAAQRGLFGASRGIAKPSAAAAVQGLASQPALFGVPEDARSASIAALSARWMEDEAPEEGFVDHSAASAAASELRQRLEGAAGFAIATQANADPLALVTLLQ